jgi:hypothetical protein
MAIGFSLVLVANRPVVFGADRIELRNLKTISDRSIASFDEDGLRLDDGTLLSWDEVEKVTLSAANAAAGLSQERLDGMLRELGGDLYRIRQRLSTGDYLGLLPQAESMYPRYAARDSETAYMVKQALMWGRLAAGQREASLEPFLRCLKYLRDRESAKIALPGERRLRFDPLTGLTPELIPIWFDARAAKEGLPEVFQRIAEMSWPRPDGVYIYYASLALAAGEDAAAVKALGAIQGKQPAITELRLILDVQREVLRSEPGVATASLLASREALSPSNRPLALYWLGRGAVGGSDEQLRLRGALDLLRIPALYGRGSPELAGAAIYQVVGFLSAIGDERGSAAVRKELLERYGQTYFAVKLRAESEKAGSAATKGTGGSP